MVVSKDSNRKRKTPSPIQHRSQSQSQSQSHLHPSRQQLAAIVGSSPEVPKRTKVHAQRKFAQGQNAPQSVSYGTISNSSINLLTSSASNSFNNNINNYNNNINNTNNNNNTSSNTTTTKNSNKNNAACPSTSTECESPTEILPNKKPKTEDFLTFLCFRGTTTLPPHLDFFNNLDKSEENERRVSSLAENTKDISNTKKASSDQEDLNKFSTTVSATTSSGVAVPANRTLKTFNAHTESKTTFMLRAASRKGRTEAKRNKKSDSNCDAAVGTGEELRLGSDTTKSNVKRVKRKGHEGEESVKEKLTDDKDDVNQDQVITVADHSTINKNNQNNDIYSKDKETDIFCTQNNLVEISTGYKNQKNNEVCDTKITETSFAIQKHAEFVALPNYIGKHTTDNLNIKNDNDCIKIEVTTNVNSTDIENNVLNSNAVRSLSSSLESSQLLEDIGCSAGSVKNNTFDHLAEDSNEANDFKNNIVDIDKELINMKRSKNSTAMASAERLSPINNSASVSLNLNKNEKRTGGGEECSMNGNKRDVNNKPTTRKGKQANENGAARSAKEATLATKDRNNAGPVKRTRQKETQIFIPSSEPSGRMTRQRAFFEPVKVQTTKEINNTNDTNALLHHNDNKNNEEIKMNMKNKTNSDIEINNKDEKWKDGKKKVETKCFNTSNKVLLPGGTTTNKSVKSEINLNVFDFSSDDEQPLAKSIKLSKNTSTGNKKNPENTKRLREKMNFNRNSLTKKTNAVMDKNESISMPTIMQNLNTCITQNIKSEINKNPKQQYEDNNEVMMEKDSTKSDTIKGDEENTKAGIEKKENDKVKDKCKEKRNRSNVANLKAPAATIGTAAVSIPIYNNEIKNNATGDKQKKIPFQSTTLLSPKGSVTGKQGRKKIKLEVNSSNNNDNEDNFGHQSPVRVQRPSRKTKEAATIYMGIIGHRLQLGDDEDDDISLTSFDRLNVREVEKMENELKRNAVATKQTNRSTGEMAKIIEESKKATTATTVTSSSATLAPTASFTTNNNGEKTNSGRRGRPPKSKSSAANSEAVTKTNTTSIVEIPKRDIEGMLVRKGAISKMVMPCPEKILGIKEELTVSKSDILHDTRDMENEEEEEDYLLNEELNETKRKLEKNFSDSDDEPLAIKAHTKINEKDNTNLDSIITTASTITTNVLTTKTYKNLCMIPLTKKPISGGGESAPVTTSSTSCFFNVTFPQTVNEGSNTNTNTTIGVATNTNTNSTISLPSTSNKINSITHKELDKKPGQEQLTGSGSTLGKVLHVPLTYNLPSMSTSNDNSIFINSNNNMIILNKGNMYAAGQPPPLSLSLPPPPSSMSATSTGNMTHYNVGHSTSQIRPLGVGLPQYNAGHSLNKSIATCGIGGSTLMTTNSATATCCTLIGTTTQLHGQNSVKYQTSSTTYPPPIEAYPSPKINPNFLTPKYDRNTLPRHMNMPSTSSGIGNNAFSSSSIKYEMTTGGISMVGNCSGNNSGNGFVKNVPLISQNNAALVGSGTTGLAVSSSTGTIATVTLNSKLSYASGNMISSSNIAPNNPTSPIINPTLCCDSLKNEISGILAANLMPSKEESGKIFGIASVTLAQSSGPDNTKCTLGKCGSVHKPVLGPVVPTESYIGDQLSGKERRKAKVNMTHEQIHKWLLECSSDPDEIQDDLDDDFDSDLRPQNYSTTPPPIRDDKESTSFSSSSKNTRDLGKSESAWSAKGPSLKATPVVAPGHNIHNRKEEMARQNELATYNPIIEEADKLSSSLIPNIIHDKANANKQSCSSRSNDKSIIQEDFKNEEKIMGGHCVTRAGDSVKLSKNKGLYDAGSSCRGNIFKTISPSRLNKSNNFEVSNYSVSMNAINSQSNRKKNSDSTTATINADNTDEGNCNIKNDVTNEDNVSNPTIINRGSLKHTPVYQQKITTRQQQQSNNNSGENNKCINSSNTTFTTAPTKKSLKHTRNQVPGIAFSLNEASVYSFDKDEDNNADDDNNNCDDNNATNFRDDNNRPQLHGIEGENAINNSLNKNQQAKIQQTSRKSLASKKRIAATVAKKVNKDLGSSQTSSVSLTLSPSEKTKLVKVSLDSEMTMPMHKGVGGNNNIESVGTRNDVNNVKVSKSSSRTIETIVSQNDLESESGDGHTFYIPLQGIGTSNDNENGIQGVAVKLDREGPEGPNQKVIMHATLVTKAKLGTRSKPLPESMNVSDIVKNLINSEKKSGTSTNSASNSLKNVPVGTVQPRFKDENLNTLHPSSTVTVNTGAGNGPGVDDSGNGLVRVNSNSSLFSASVKSGNNQATIPVATTTTAPPPQPITSAAAGTSIATNTTGHSNVNNKKLKDDMPIKMSNNTAFPRYDDPTQMVEAPIFRPTEKEFSDPIEFIERITPIAARFGICKIIPPASFKPECRISDEMRFTAYNQYVHKMLYRWGPSAKELSAIKKYLATQSIAINHPPWIGGMEVDLPRLYHTVQELGGLKEVIEKKKWARVAEEMCIPKLAQDRVAKLDDIYCKYLLPYDTLSPVERQKLFDEVEADWAKREARARRNADRFVHTESVSNEEEDMSSENDEEESEEEVDGVSMECIVKGRSMPLSQFYRIARNTMALWFKNSEPTVNEVEAEFWRHVAVRDSHVCVHSGSIDSSGWGFGFPSPGPKGKGSNYSRHPWNLKVLTNNSGSMLRSLGPVMGVTVPTLHVGMLFSACCWYRDPHGLSWIEYLHTGASKLWYGIPDDQSSNFRAALTSLIPTHCQNKTIWLPCDTVMIPPHMLTDRGVSLCRIEQRPGEFIVVFPRAYTSSLATGYVVSESVYFAASTWLDLAKDDFRDIHESCEPAMFSLEQLLFALGYDQRVPPEILQQMLPMLQEVYEKETAAREQLKAAGVTAAEKAMNEKGAKSRKQQQPPFKSIDNECDLCRANLYISMVCTDEGNVYCLQHALRNLNNGNIQAKKCKLIYAYNVDDIENLIETLKVRIQQKRNMNLNKKQK